MCDQCANPFSSTTGSRRKRLWDLAHQCHCPVVSVCFPLAVLRQLVNKAIGSKAMADDYEIHVGAVAECTRRTRLSEMLQRDLDVRYAASVQAFKAAKDTKAVANLWAAAVQRGDLSGALWASLTHPRCDEALQEVVLREMHMLQHQAGAAVRIDAARLNALVKENAVLGRELGKAQERSTHVIAEKSAEIDLLNAQLIRLRALVVGKDSRLAFVLQDMEQLKAALPDFENTDRLRKNLDQLKARQVDLEAQNAHLRQQLIEAQRLLSMRAPGAPPAAGADQYTSALKETHLTVRLKEKVILCFGGRSGNIANYRDVIEKVGANFSHHDGGLEDNPNALDAVLAAADLVICQTGCISHNAYWRVKDFCKRTGKQCVFIENPSVSSLTRTLKQVTGDEALGELNAKTVGNG